MSEPVLVECPNPRCLNGHEVSLGPSGEPESEGRCALACDHGWVAHDRLFDPDWSEQRQREWAADREQARLERLNTVEEAF